MKGQTLVSTAPIGLEVFNRLYMAAIACAEGEMNNSEDGSVEPMLVLIDELDPWRANYSPASLWEEHYQARLGDFDLQSLARSMNVLMLIHFESVWLVYREMPKDAIDYSINAEMELDRQLAMQFRLASQDSLAVGCCPSKFVMSQWMLQRTKLVFPKMTFNGTGQVTFRAGADA